MSSHKLVSEPLSLSDAIIIMIVAWFEGLKPNCFLFPLVSFCSTVSTAMAWALGRMHAWIELQLTCISGRIDIDYGWMFA